MNDIWVASDLHLFNQENDTSHPFRSKEYIEQMTRNYHTMIQESDLFIFLGDLCDPIATTDDQWSMISNLIMGIPGRRIMCKGNHDTLDNSYYYALGFDLVCDIGHVDHMIFSHKPVRVAPDEINIHGHLHHEKDTKLGYQHLNVYNYLIQHKDSYDKPILLQDIFNAANDQNHDAEPDWGTYRPEDSKFTNLRSYLDLKKSGAYVADLSEYITIAPVDEAYDVIDESVSDSVLDEILFQDTDETQYWEADDDSAQKKEDAAKYGDSNPVIKQSRKNDVVAESANTSGEMKFELKTYDGQLHSLSILAKDLLHERMMIHPEEVDAEALKTFKEVDKFVNYFNNLANAEAAASLNGTEFTPGYVAGYSILRENNRGIKDDTITNTLLPIYNGPDKLQQYVSDSIQFLAKIETAVCGLIGSHIAAIRESINIAYQESMSPTGRKELIQETKKFLDSKETQDKIVQIREFYARPEHKTTPEKCKTITFDYNAVNLDRRVIISGDMYGNPSLKNLMVPSRFLVRLAVYDVIIVAHGASADQNRWVIEPIWLEMNNQYTTSLDDVVRYCKKYYGSKKILVLSCNPDHIIPDNKLYDVVDYASNTVLFEDAMTVTPSMTPNIDQTLDQLIEYLAQKIKALNHLKAQILSQIDDLDLMAYPRELKYVYIDKTSANASIKEKSISGSKQFNTAIGETTSDLFQYYEMVLFQFRMLMKHIRNRDRKLLKENVMFWNDGNYTLWNTVCGIPSPDTKYEFRCDPTLGYRYNDINEMTFDMELYQVSAMGSNGATTCPHEGLPEGLHSQLVERISNLNSINIDEVSKEYKNYDNIRPMEKEEKKKVADKYGLRVVGGESPAEIEDRRKTPEQRYNERREKQLQDLKRARKIKKRKAFVRKVKSHLPGAKNEDATVVDEPNIPDSNVEHSPLYGDKADFFYNYDYPKSANTYAERLKLEESAIKRVSDDGTAVPEKCPKCGSKVGLYLKGEPVWLCSNKDCGKYFGTAPCNEAASKPVEDEPITKAELSKLGIRDLRTFQRWLKNNIKYENMTKLKSPREVMESKHGCCHDQVIFELDVLRTLGYKPRAYFAIEFNDTQGGETHSYVIVEDHGKMYWLENAWGRYAGLNEVDRSTFLKQAHEEHVWGDINRFPDIEIKRFVGTPGDDLQTVVDRSLNDKKPMDESTLGNLVRDTPAIMNNMFANAMYTGKWDKVEAGLTKLIQSADSIDRINYLRRDFRYGVTSMTKLLEKMKQVQRGELANKDIEKRIAGGNTPEKMQAHIKWIKTVGYPMLNQRAKELRAANKAKLMETYQFELIGNQVLFIDKDSALTEAKTAEKKVPVYIVLVHSGTAVSNAIKTISHSEFSHASISFDSSLEKMYSFARKDPANPFIGGFRHETIGKGFYDKKEIPYAVYMVSCTENQVKKMKKRLNYFIQNEAKFKFDFGGLVKNYLGIVDNPEYRWFCSRFVADILNAGAPKNNPYVKEPSLQDPDDFKNMEQAHLVINGDNLMKYDRKLVDRRTKKILREEQLGSKVQNESAVLDVDGMSLYESIVLDYHMNHLSENVLEDFYQYTKSFKIKYDNQGNIIIRRREYDQLDAHYRNSLKLIKAAEKAGDLNTVKDELCKLHYMINLISGQYLRKKASPKSDKVKKEMMDLRAVMMNVFTQHLKYVMTHDPSFNFNAYYNTTKYSQDVIVNQAAVSAIGKSIATALL